MFSVISVCHSVILTMREGGPTLLDPGSNPSLNNPTLFVHGSSPPPLCTGSKSWPPSIQCPGSHPSFYRALPIRHVQTCSTWTSPRSIAVTCWNLGEKAAVVALASFGCVTGRPVPWILSLFWTSCDVSTGFQIQARHPDPTLNLQLRGFFNTFDKTTHSMDQYKWYRSLLFWECKLSGSNISSTHTLQLFKPW